MLKIRPYTFTSVDRDKLYEDIACSIYAIRHQKKISMAELSRRTDLDLRTLYKIESEKKCISLTNLIKIAFGLGCSLDDLINIKGVVYHED